MEILANIPQDFLKRYKICKYLDFHQDFNHFYLSDFLDFPQNFIKTFIILIENCCLNIKSQI